MPPEADTGKERLQKILARAGFGSRRTCEELIVEGRVTVNEQTVTVLGSQADPMRDEITVDGERVKLPRPAYWVVHKPAGMFFSDSNTDDAVASLVGRHEGRLLVAGRLDRHSSGVLLVTNDGRLANVLTHPRYRVPKVYHVTVKNEARPETLRTIERAMYYACNGGKFERLSVIERAQGRATVRVAAYEGLPPSMRDIFLKYGLPVKSIVRVSIGPLELGRLAPGESHRLRGDEVSSLHEFVDRAEHGRLQYEAELVTPETFDRSTATPEFQRKKTGARATIGGQKRVAAEVRLRTRGFGDREDRDGRERRPRTDARSGDSRGYKDRAPKREGEYRRGPRREDTEFRAAPRKDAGEFRKGPGGPRKGPGGFRKGPGGPRKDAGEFRRGSGGPRKDEGEFRRGPGGPRKDAGEFRRGPGGPRKDAGEFRRGPGGPRKDAGGFRKGPGGPRKDAGGFRKGPGGPRKDAGGFRKGPGGPRKGPGGPRKGPGGFRKGPSGPRRSRD